MDESSVFFMDIAVSMGIANELANNWSVLLLNCLPFCEDCIFGKGRHERIVCLVKVVTRGLYIW